MKSLKQIGLLVVLLFAATAFGGVNLKNGNFYITYTDIVVPGGGEKLEISRTYNSKATELGWFGFGWGSYFETNLVVSADGSVVIHENGAGGKTRFTPKNPVDIIIKSTECLNSTFDNIHYHFRQRVYDK